MLNDINLMSETAVYLQIENDVMFAIASGKLKAGDRLPSVRELSERVHVNPNTVAKAYRDLEVMGYVYTRRGMGIFINRGIEETCRENCRKNIITRLSQALAEAKAAGIPARELKDVFSRCMNLEISPYGQVPEELFQVQPAKKGE